MRRIALAPLAAAPLLLGGCIFAVGTGDRSDDRRLSRLEQRITAAEQKLGIGQAKKADAPKPPEAPTPPQAPTPPAEPRKP